MVKFPNWNTFVARTVELTNGITVHELGSRFIGCDIEEQNVRLGKLRLADAIKDAKDDRAVAGKTGLVKTPRTKSA
tara:strand:- start:6600 stop:6827 length:228 start_codon:yes stop_codon:yes gene_type:complete